MQFATISPLITLICAQNYNLLIIALDGRFFPMLFRCSVRDAKANLRLARIGVQGTDSDLRTKN
jgi:hypothetical protein